ncbi:similar to Saccharomyces cerevisiae YPR116W RRG8 Putative protein of unknown function, required for mitochondrial genome maintenance [Maudiozyma saulgeensis]|uniref:Required for respiratory growth protein 8, mitochondrial n=1 Tax=Maudiozyma saulgeensis TaxID=1789683 RepID=A0A1X7QYA9_9SACH|nr:similar to Saccharomyces cerevisiae YPR116W RRG8 Putative protein of unknown function, required for mitochondrial genome maintenance [Kazachstania saulgeensis]
MPFDTSLLKSLQIAKVAKKPQAPLPLRTSPLFTHFERWAGKTRRLLIKEPNHLSMLKSFNLRLNDNPFAHILSSPSRLDRIGKIKLPKQLLIQVKNNINEKGFNILLNTMVDNSIKDTTASKHSYILNKMSMFDKNVKNVKSILPLHILSEPDIGKKIPLIQFDKNKVLDEYLVKSKEIIWDQLIQLPLTEKSRTNAESSSTQVIVTYDKSSQDILKLKTTRDKTTNENNYIITFNLASINEPKFDELFAHGSKQLHLTQEHNSSLILQIYRVLMLIT